MEVIDRHWIKAHLGARGDQKRLADAIGITPDQVTKILNGTRKVQADEIPAILRYFNADQPPGFREPPTTPFTPAAYADQPDAWTDRLRDLFGQGLRHPQTLRLGQALLNFSLLAGDVVVIDMARTATTGELALVAREESNGETRTEVRLYLSPWLVGGDPTDQTPPLLETERGVHVRHPVVGSFRGAETST